MLKRIAAHLEPLLATLLGIAAIATAYAAYQSGLEGGTESEELTGAAAAANIVFSSVTQGIQQRTRDEQIFLEYVKAEQQGDKDFARYLRVSLMDGNLRTGLRDAEDPDSDTLSPVDSPKYNNPSLDEAESLAKETEAAIDTAQRAGERADRFDLVTVILAVALFFFGLAAVLRTVSTRLVLTGAGTTILVVSLVLIATA